MKRKSGMDDDTVNDGSDDWVNEQWIKATELSVLKIGANASSSHAPFKGSSEFLHPSDKISYYTDLLRIIDPTSERRDIGIYNKPSKLKKATGQLHWRRVLSRSYETKTPISWKGQRFATVEHALASEKFAYDNPTFSSTFALGIADILDPTNDGGEDYQGRRGLDYSKGSEVKVAMAIASKTGRYSKGGKVAYKRPDAIKMDESYLEMDKDRLSRLIEDITYSKFYHDEEAKRILLATRYALLVETSTKGYKVLYELMRVRCRIAADMKLDAEERQSEQLDEGQLCDGQVREELRTDLEIESIDCD